jgi:hypothetical protein
MGIDTRGEIDLSNGGHTVAGRLASDLSMDVVFQADHDVILSLHRIISTLWAKQSLGIAFTKLACTDVF